MSRWVDLPVRVGGEPPTNPMVVLAALNERDRERALELLGEMEYSAWADRMLEIGALHDQWAAARESMDDGGGG